MTINFNTLPYVSVLFGTFVLCLECSAQITDPEELRKLIATQKQLNEDTRLRIEKNDKEISDSKEILAEVQAIEEKIQNHKDSLIQMESELIAQEAIGFAYRTNFRPKLSVKTGDDVLVIKSTGGVEFKEIEILEILANAIRIKHSTRFTTLKFGELPDHMLKDSVLAPSVLPEAKFSSPEVFKGRPVESLSPGHLSKIREREMRENERKTELIAAANEKSAVKERLAVEKIEQQDAKKREERLNQVKRLESEIQRSKDLLDSLEDGKRTLENQFAIEDSPFGPAIRTSNTDRQIQLRSYLGGIQTEEARLAELKRRLSELK
jgi:DNA repair exonuclease SbcCD ATPase subunit